MDPEGVISSLFPCVQREKGRLLFGGSARVLAEIKALLTEKGERSFIKTGKSTRAERIRIGERDRFLKTYFASSRWKIFLNLFRRPYPLKAAFNAYGVARRGFKVILPEGGWLESKWTLSELSGGLLYPFVEEFLELPTRWSRAREDRLFLEDLLIPILELLERLHKAGIYIRDTKANNFLVHPRKEPVLFDLDEVRFFNSPVPPRLRKKNLKVLYRTLKRKGIKEEWLRNWFEK